MVSKLGGLLNYRPSSEFEKKAIHFVSIFCLILLLAYPFLAAYRITWDIPPGMSADGALFADEGFYSTDAISWYLEGSWHMENEYNQFIVLPLLQWIQGLCFVVFGFGLGTVRFLNLFFALAWIGSSFLLLHRFLGWRWAAIGTTLLAYNHVTFAMSNFAIAEMPMSFFATLAFVFAAYSRGRFAYLMAGLAAFSFSMAFLTKVNTVFLGPPLALMMIMVDRSLRPVLIKLVVCSSIFFSVLGMYYLFLVRPHFEEFIYFFSLNVGLASSSNPIRMMNALVGIVGEFLFTDKILVPLFPIFAAIPILFIKSRKIDYLWLVLAAWAFMFLLLYSYYGRIYTRFFTVAFPAFFGLIIFALKTLWEVRERYFPLFVVAGFVVAASFAMNVWQIGTYMANRKDTFNDMARDIVKIMDADPRGNNIVMGHNSPSLSLRSGIIPRHDRYGMLPFEERARRSRADWYITEQMVRSMPVESYYGLTVWLQRYYELELVGRYNILDNYRGYSIAFYRMTPREDEIEIGNEIYGFHN